MKSGDMNDHTKLTKTQLIAQLQSLLKNIINTRNVSQDRHFILELRKTQRKLEQTQNRYADLYDFIPIGCAVLDDRGRILDINLTGAQMLGHSRKQLDKLPFELFLNLNNRRQFHRHLKRVFSSNTRVATEFHLKYNTNDFHYVCLESIAIQENKNMTNSCHTAIVNIGERKQAEEILRLNHNKLEKKIGQRIAQLSQSNKTLQEEITARKLTETELLASEKHYRTLVENQTDLICSWDVDGTLTFVNKAYCHYFGKQPDELIGHKFLFLIPEEDQHKAQRHFASLNQRNPITKHEHRVIVAPSNEVRWLQWTNLANFDEAGQIIGYQSVGQDITDRKCTEQLLHLSAIVFKNTNEAIIITNNTRNIILVNHAFSHITGYQSKEIIGKNLHLLSSRHYNKRFFQRIEAILARKRQWQGEIWSQRKSGELFPAWVNISVARDEQEQIINHVIVFSDITSIKQTEERLNYLAHHDPLTDIPNRLLFKARLENSLQRAQRHDYQVALLFLDLDRFKIINDTLGHNAGDQLLQTVASRLTKSIRNEDTVARLGGDEFAVILENVKHSDDIVYLAEKILEIITQPVRISGQDIITSFSIGIALYPADANNSDNLKRAADSALYQAKRKGRANYQFYTSEFTAHAVNLLSIEHGLRLALLNNEFILHYQPQIDLKTEKVIGVEALLRWQHPELGLLEPDKFINIAEDTGLIHTIGQWVLYTACLQAKVWHNTGFPKLQMSVNLSGHTLLHDPKLVMHVNQALIDSQLEPHLLKLEITEGILQTAEHSIAVLFELKSLGIGLAIDDFGTGYSCLNSLKRLPIDTLKIDRSFIQDIMRDENDQAIASTIIAMARTLNLKVIAEGVQDAEQLSFLRTQNCNMVQGYIFSQPITAIAIEDYLRNHLLSPE
ncbi:PAS domain S-box-containing protein/diguanylate cyclase (GGDEF) domain-containing protein [Nitrosomonas cryotolerans]|uniref:PAS domain S-box-containing protein/diguanylate cyclase (GGDEF) domain-containing protein n=2 Tax=Nitrosomonas cryotolerans TaxID=44575 RepID=A0A1N6IIG3_9PROT|nr:PAS domain S-box-containing protein/diguanylate cyclase (GGDEF) domain-containing protein [Nitrosomonas cryotolerans]SIO31798.1 PAS domain S-box-containing protein/diguanylate cyclase (GGDEF) domain-containing protein [Nitrosomonas cryotolerans ATCC 49181]